MYARFDAVSALCWAAAATALAALAQPTFSFWWWEWTRPHGFYSHGVLALPLAGLILWHRRTASAAKPEPWFLLPLALCVAGLVAAERGLLVAVCSAALIALFAAAVGFAGGARYLARVAVPALLVLLLAVPLPGPLLHDATAGLQRLCAAGAGYLLSGIGFGPVVRIGTVLSLPNYTLDVDAPCSGLQTLLTAATLSVGIAALSDVSRTHKVLLVAGALPVALLSNLLRIAAIGVIGDSFGATAARRLHDASGIASVLLCTVLILTLLRSAGCRRLAGQPLF